MLNFLKDHLWILILSGLLISCYPEENQDKYDWPEYLSSPNRDIFSSLDQIDTTNVHQLKPAWTYHSGDFGEMECNPLIIDGIVYAVTATKEVIALNGVTGEEVWRFAPSEEKNKLRSRGRKSLTWTWF